MRAVISNTGPIIALAGIQQLALLSELFGAVHISPQVYRELSGGSERIPSNPVAGIHWIKTENLTQPLDPLLTYELDSGEATTIALARERPGSLILIDEKKGRRIAEKVYGISILGTGGVLLRAKTRGIIPSLKPLLLQMKANGYFLSERVVQGLCAAARES